VWGAFAFVWALAGRPAWQLLPCTAILAYGWTFHMGFFNFYLSLGLCFWSLALLWVPAPARVGPPRSCWPSHTAANAVPLMWALGMVVYAWIARRLPDRWRARLAILALALPVAAHFGAGWKFVSRWSLTQITAATGGDQILVFDAKYAYLFAVLMLC
jgi:hypothetical protein